MPPRKTTKPPAKPKPSARKAAATGAKPAAKAKPAKAKPGTAKVRHPRAAAPPKRKAPPPAPPNAPRKPRRVIGPSERATRDELAAMPTDVGGLAIAAAALELARGLDDTNNSLTSKSAAAKAHMEIMGQLRALAPKKRRGDGIDNLKDKRAQRRGAGVPKTSD
jgi:hypothetical protein